MKYIKSLFTAILTAGLVSGLSSCRVEEEKVDPVDLRFDVEDEYMLTAADPEEISFIVRSMSDPWEVYSYNPDWCEISPSSGEMEEKYTVTVQYTDNEQLDDRIDTLVIQSDYWIGKWVTVRQKGTAYLEVSAASVTLPKDGGQESFSIRANQTWAAEVTEGGQWLTLEDGTSGELDGIVTISAEENRGAMRYGAVTIYDRHGVEAASVEIMQDGAQLDPETAELRVLFDGTRVELPVVSNTEWIAEKNDPDVEWYSFENPSNSGSATLVILLEPNLSSSLKEATFTLRTLAEEGFEAVERQVTLKQACEPVSVRHYFKDGYGSWTVYSGNPSVNDAGVTFTGASRLIAHNLQTGTYTFRISHDSADARSLIFYTFPGEGSANELRYHMNAATGQTEVSSTPWSALQNTSFDTSVSNEATMVMTEAPDGYIHAEWLLNGVEFTELASTSILPRALWGSNMTVYIGSSAGTVTFEWYEFTPPVDWGE